MVEVVKRKDLRRGDVRNGDLRSVTHVPRLFAELLEEVGVAIRHVDQMLNGLMIPTGVLVLDRRDESGPGIITVEGIDVDIGKESLRVGARLTREPGKRRKSSTCNQDR